MDRSTIERGTLLLADISGYTAFLSGVELEHSLDILASLLGSIADRLKGQFRVQEIEGDAVFAYAPAGAIDGPAVFAAVEACYFAFCERRELVARQTSCTCRACSAVPELDLKIVVHESEYARHRIAGRESLVGPGVIMAHRLLKNSAAERLGSRGYTLITEDALLAHGLDLVQAGPVAHEEEYDVGRVRALIVDLAARWAEAMARRSVVVARDEAFGSFEVETAMPVAEAWTAVTAPDALVTWMADRVDQEGGVRGVGTRLHCVHGRTRFVNEILDWKPYRYFTWEFGMNGARVRGTISVTESGAGEPLRIAYHVRPAGSLRQRALARMMTPMVRSWMRGAGRRLAGSLREREETLRSS